MIDIAFLIPHHHTSSRHFAFSRFTIVERRFSLPPPTDRQSRKGSKYLRELVGKLVGNVCVCVCVCVHQPDPIQKVSVIGSPTSSPTSLPTSLPTSSRKYFEPFTD